MTGLFDVLEITVFRYISLPLIAVVPQSAKSTPIILLKSTFQRILLSRASALISIAEPGAFTTILLITVKSNTLLST